MLLMLVFLKRFFFLFWLTDSITLLSIVLLLSILLSFCISFIHERTFISNILKWYDIIYKKEVFILAKVLEHSVKKL